MSTLTDRNLPSGWDNPAWDCVAITPSDSVAISSPCRGVYVGGAGNVAIVTPAGSVVTFANAVAGSILPVECVRINATNTTATNLVGLL